MTFTGMNALEEVRQLARKTAALTRAAENLLDNPIHVTNEDGRARLEDLAHLLEAASEAAETTVEACAIFEGEYSANSRGRGA